MDINVFRGLLTALVMLLFIGLCLRSFSGKRSGEYREAEQLPLQDGDRPPAGTGQASKHKDNHS